MTSYAAANDVRRCLQGQPSKVSGEGGLGDRSQRRWSPLGEWNP